MDRKPDRAQIALQTRDRLLVATEMLVVRDGVVSLSVRRIAGEAGVNSALIRYHFGDTDGLLRELAHLNAARITDLRNQLLDALETKADPDFIASVDALVLPLWTAAAMSEQHRAIVVLDEIFARAGPTLQEEIWAGFAQGVRRVSLALQQALGCADGPALAWRIRFVTAAALDIPPRSSRTDENRRSAIYGLDTPSERLEQFRIFAQQAILALR